MINNGTLYQRENNVIYKNQFAVMAFISMIVFKIGMLPSFLYATVGRDVWIVIGILMLIEALMFCVTLYIVKRVNLLEETSKWFMVLHAFIYVYSMIRLTTLYSGLITYTSSSLFDQGRIDFIIISFAIVIPYLVSKRGNSLARLYEFTFYFLAGILFIMLITPDFKLDFSELLPIMIEKNNKLVNGFINYSIWFGDYIPLLYFCVKDNKNKILNKVSVPVSLIGAVVGVVAFYILFISVYGEAGEFVYFAFNRMAVFNKLSELLGATNFLSIIIWLIMALLQITMVFKSATNALMCFIKNKNWAITINIIIISLVQWLFIKNIETAHKFAIGYVKYFVLACQFLIPLSMAIYSYIKEKERKKNEKTI